MYDPRMCVMLEHIAKYAELPLDIRDCLHFSGENDASHQAQHRPSPDELYASLRFNSSTGQPDSVPGVIFLFDDMLTTGAHYVATTRKLSEIFPGVRIVGNFIARRVIPNPFDDFDVL